MDPSVKQEASWLAQRLKEPSTYAGIAAMLAAFHISLSGDVVSAVTSIGMGIGGLLAFALGESK